MNYKKNYYDFISSRKNMNREKLDGNIYELHHILPRSLGGLDNKETYKSMSEICKKYKKSQGCASIELKKNGFVMIDNNKFRRINDGK